MLPKGSVITTTFVNTAQESSDTWWAARVAGNWEARPASQRHPLSVYFYIGIPPGTGNLQLVSSNKKVFYHTYLVKQQWKGLSGDVIVRGTTNELGTFEFVIRDGVFYRFIVMTMFSKARQC